jgi:protein-tyrosine phosphatase
VEKIELGFTVELGGTVRREAAVAVWVGPKSNASAKIPRSRKGREISGTQSNPIRRRMGMDITWITEQIGVGGGIWNADNMMKVEAEGITHIIDMQIEFDDRDLVPPHDPDGPNIQVLWNPTDDDFQPKPPSLLRFGVEFAEKALKDPGAKLFIHCAAGVHRAPMMALAVLGSRGWNLQDARHLIEDKRPVADFADVYVESVERFLAEGLNHRGL